MPLHTCDMSYFDAWCYFNSCHHVWYVTRMDEARQSGRWGMAHIRMRRATNEMGYTHMSHVHTYVTCTHICHTCDWGMLHMWLRHSTRERGRLRLTQIDASCHSYVWGILYKWMCYVHFFCALCISIYQFSLKHMNDIYMCIDSRRIPI